MASNRIDFNFSTSPLATRIQIEDIPFEDLASFLYREFKNENPNSEMLLAVDSRLKPFLHLDDIPTLFLSAGEQSKSWEEVRRILDAAIEVRLTAKSMIACIGGGAACDVTAFGAAIYMRGIQTWFAPTTLLAMVDACFGGKSAINWHKYKNIVGAFHPARRIVISPFTLTTLSDREYRSGIAEVIKAALLGDQELWNILRNQKTAILARETEVVKEIIYRSLIVKGNMVRDDFQEKNDHNTSSRARLNLGHTFAHALESVRKFTGITHGEAVVWGIIHALRLGITLDITPRHYHDEVLEMVDSYGFTTDIDNLDIEKLVEAMRHDKKNVGGSIEFVLQRALGDTTFHSMSPADALPLLHTIIERWSSS